MTTPRPQTDPARVTDRGAGRGTARSAAPAWAVVAIACAGQFLVVLDVSVVNVALPSMRADLGMTPDALQWVLNAYSVAFAGFMLLGGRAADLFGRKRIFLAGLAVFTAASLAGGLAQAGWQLLAARAVQGLGAAVLAPATLTLLTSAVPAGRARTRAVGTWAAVGAAGGAAGGLVGGSLTDLLSWRWVLLVNVPVGALVLAAGALRLTEARGGRGRRLDLPGALLVTAGLGVLAYGIVRTGQSGWGAAATLVPFLGGLALLGAFLVLEARGREPLMPLKVFRTRAVAAANAAMFVFGAGSFAVWFFMTVYAQNILGYTPFEAGVALVPSSLSIVLGSKAAPWLMHRASPRTVAVAGGAIGAAGFAWQSMLSAHGGYLTSILGPGIVLMAGLGMATTPLAALATGSAAPEDAGLVSGIVNTARTMGGALGLAVLSTAAAARTAGGTGPEALTSGYALAFRIGCGICVAAVVLLLVWLPRTGGQQPRERREPAAEPD